MDLTLLSLSIKVSEFEFSLAPALFPPRGVLLAHDVLHVTEGWLFYGLAKQWNFPVGFLFVF